MPLLTTFQQQPAANKLAHQMTSDLQAYQMAFPQDNSGYLHNVHANQLDPWAQPQQFQPAGQQYLYNYGQQ